MKKTKKNFKDDPTLFRLNTLLDSLNLLRHDLKIEKKRTDHFDRAVEFYYNDYCHTIESLPWNNITTSIKSKKARKTLKSYRESHLLMRLCKEAIDEISMYCLRSTYKTGMDKTSLIQKYQSAISLDKQT